MRGRHLVRWNQIVAAAFIVVLAGCASMTNTPAQDLAWETWKQCDRFRTIILKEIKPNGDIWVWTVFGHPDLPAWRECVRAAWTEQARGGKLSSVSTPSVQTDDAKGLVKFAYFTDQPPADGTYLRTTFGRNMPPDVKAFTSGSRVTFFYAITQAGRVLRTETNWISPTGKVAKNLEQTVNQMGRPGEWTWRTQHAQAELTESGRWVVELLIDGHPVGTYEFILKATDR